MKLTFPEKQNFMTELKLLSLKTNIFNKIKATFY